MYGVPVSEFDRWSSLLATAAGERAAQPQNICRLCVDMLDVSGAGITMLSASGNREVVCSTDDVSARIEELQGTLGEGPCYDAVQAGAPVLIADLLNSPDHAVERWPAFHEAAGAIGVRAVFAFPLSIGAINVGVLDLYRERPGELEADSLAGALTAADAAALALLHLDKSPNDSGPALLDSLASHQMQVHRATGMVQVQLGVSTADAFLALRARAFSIDRPIVEVANDVVERRLRFSPEDQ
jgi:hypothetical protein